MPPKAIFDGNVSDLIEIADASKDRILGNRVLTNKTVAVCFIGLASYFEAFCKHQFAAAINICPQILSNFIKKRGDDSNSLKDVFKIKETINFTLGSLLSEKYDFGSAKAINSLYFDLLGITPFTSTEVKKYAEFLKDRNLLVHDGGIYTYKYHEQKLNSTPPRGLVHAQSLGVTKTDFNNWAGFLQKIAEKMAKATNKSMKDFINRQNIVLHEEQERAIEYISWESS
ncbi:MAG: hypothetical protein AB1757_17380 [Acidobacteriota bacterium]